MVGSKRGTPDPTCLAIVCVLSFPSFFAFFFSEKLVGKLFILLSTIFPTMMGQSRGLASFLNLLLLLGSFPLLLLSQQPYQECDRVEGSKRVLLFAVDGLRGDVLEALLPQLPNIRRIMGNNGRHQVCENAMDENCARTVTGNRFVPHPLSSGGVGTRNYTFSSLEEAQDSPLNNNYFWYSMPGWGSIFSGLDVNTTKVNNNTHISASSWAQAITATGGSFLKQAKDAGYKTALAGVPAVVTGFWPDLTYPIPPPVTPGVIDYECGFDDVAALPLVAPDATSSCNLDFRLSTSQAEYADIQDNNTANFGRTLIERGCAHVVVLHIDAPDIAMHAFGMMTEQYNASLFYLDELVGKILDAVEKDVEEYGTGWLTMMVSDHGGQTNEEASQIFLGGTLIFILAHGQNFYFDEVIPYFVGGFGSGVALEEFVQVPRNLDAHPTILAHLGIRTRGTDGVVNGVKELDIPIFDDDGDDDDDDSDSAGSRVGGWGGVLGAVLVGLVGLLF